MVTKIDEIKQVISDAIDRLNSMPKEEREKLGLPAWAKKIVQEIKNNRQRG